MKRASCLAAFLLLPSLVLAQKPPLVDERSALALANEISGASAKRNVEAIALNHRTRGSRPFRAAAEHILAQLKAAGLEDARIEQFPADGKVFYGTQRSRPPWNAEMAELWEMREGWQRPARVTSWEEMPMSLAQDSESGEVRSELVDIGAGTDDFDYAGKDVKGKFVLTSSQPGAVVPLAVGKYGAAAIVSYALNQPQAWRGEDENLVRWGHLETFAAHKTFAFMVSLKQARAWQNALRTGRVLMLGKVTAGQKPGFYDIVTATIPGADPKLKDEEIAFSCHLDHPRPGANDNASGCATILEIARAYAKLIREKRIAPPARTLRFIWPPEIEGTLTLLNARPDIAQRIKAVVHMDMVGGNPAITKAIFHVTRGPASLPSFVNDVAETIAEFVNAHTDEFAASGRAAYSLHDPEGGKEALLAQMAEFSSGSDHQVYTDSSWSIPAVYLNDWPDRYIHTNLDHPANIDATKLKRAAFLGAATAHFLANMSEKDTDAIFHAIKSRSLIRTARTLERLQALDAAERPSLTRFHIWYEAHMFSSLERFFPLSEAARKERQRFVAALEQFVGEMPAARAASGEMALVFRRNPEVKGTMGAFGYDYFEDKYGVERAGRLPLLSFNGARGSGGDYAYEILNLANGRRTVADIRDTVSAIYGPVRDQWVLEYLKALESIGVVARVEPARAD